MTTDETSLFKLLSEFKMWKNDDALDEQRLVQHELVLAHLARLYGSLYWNSQVFGLCPQIPLQLDIQAKKLFKLVAITKTGKLMVCEQAKIPECDNLGDKGLFAIASPYPFPKSLQDKLLPFPLYQVKLEWLSWEKGNREVVETGAGIPLARMKEGKWDKYKPPIVNLVTDDILQKETVHREQVEKYLSNDVETLKQSTHSLKQQISDRNSHWERTEQSYQEKNLALEKQLGDLKTHHRWTAILVLLGTFLIGGLAFWHTQTIESLKTESNQLKEQIAKSYKQYGEKLENQSTQLTKLKNKLNQDKEEQMKNEQFLRDRLFFRDRLEDDSLGPAMVWIPSGTLARESVYDTKDKVHTVFINRFAIGQYEVTFAEYDKFAQATGRKKPEDEGWGRGNRPVINVSLYDAKAYADWLSQQTGYQYRLPSETKWEYAARAGKKWEYATRGTLRAGTETQYWWDNYFGENNANCRVCGSQWDGKQTAPVGSFKANSFGLYDTVGNVAEWMKQSSGYSRHGYSWNDDFDTPLDFLSHRFAFHMGFKVVGFRLIRCRNKKLENQSHQLASLKNKFDQNRNEKFFFDRLKYGGFGPAMVWIPTGTFRMGDIQGGGEADEQLVHTISINRFAIGQYEVTFAEYDEFAKATGRKKPEDEGWGRSNRPVINISWYDAVAYTEWLTQQTKHKYRLPTEAEWEYAARAGTDTKYWWGNGIGENNANCTHCRRNYLLYNRQTVPVGSFEANPFGLYDTVGNVWEWTCSEYESKYNGKEKQCFGNNRANNYFLSLRGGSWGSKPDSSHAAFRGKFSPNNRNKFKGFRVVRELVD
jgi:formylglycine-generating enzyme required for sulfatase activity